MVFELFDNKFLLGDVLHQVSDEDEADQPPGRADLLKVPYMGDHSRPP
jgi:hypothetical protein